MHAFLVVAKMRDNVGPTGGGGTAGSAAVRGTEHPQGGHQSARLQVLPHRPTRMGHHVRTDQDPIPLSQHVGVSVAQHPKTHRHPRTGRRLQDRVH